MDCFVAPLLAMTKTQGFSGSSARFPPIVFQIATHPRDIWGRDLRLRTSLERIAAESQTLPSNRFRSPQHLAFRLRLCTRSSLSRLHKRRFDDGIPKISA